mgnify:FL=1
MYSVELRDKIENLQIDMEGLTALVHAFLEGIRSDSVSIDEITHATAVLYLLVDLMTERMKDIKKDLASID